ncbi:winged helix-turn-helix domain-containing protein [Kitasatospora sp. NPDC048538]|uniref:winged helix-turn-helix domain-containing protein n=1 Tax=unclassified Kitasatospora TaxID=2633591 RepID=UPI0033CD1F3A
MTDDLTAPATGTLPEHAVRTALLRLLAETGTLTSTEAAARLGFSSGLCSFHLRQLARHGLVEEAPPVDGRARPWRLPREPDPAEAPAGHPARGAGQEADGFGELARGLEDESYRRWLAHRDGARADWRRDEAFSAVVHLTPAELSAVGAEIRRVLARYRDRDDDPAARPADARPVAAVARLFPLLPGEDGPEH